MPEAHVAYADAGPALQSAVVSEHNVRYLRRRYANAAVLAIGDSLALLLSIAVAGLMRGAISGEILVPHWVWILPLGWCGGALLKGLLPSWGLGPVEELRRITLLLAAVFAATSILLFVSKEAAETSRFTLIGGFAIGLFVLPFVRIQVKRILVAQEWWGTPAVVYGSGPEAERVVDLLLQERGLGYSPVGVFGDGSPGWRMRVAGVRVLGGLDNVAREAPVAILTMSSIGWARSRELLEGPLRSYRTVLVIPDLPEAPSLWVRPRDLCGTLCLQIDHNLISPFARVVKRTVCLLLVLGAAPLWVPLVGLLALLVWLEDGGNPFFLQERVGFGGRSFRTVKFRTMVRDAERVLQRKLAEDERLRLEWETFYKLRRDPRVTRVGRVLRRFSLDEMPQLLNVLRGEMALVGPRPLPAYHHEQLAERVRKQREQVRPGITGLWQISGRSNTGTAGMEIWDPYYVRNWSIWLDAVILVRTFRIVLSGEGAC